MSAWDLLSADLQWECLRRVSACVPDGSGSLNAVRATCKKLCAVAAGATQTLQLHGPSCCTVVNDMGQGAGGGEVSHHLSSATWAQLTDLRRIAVSGSVRGGFVDTVAAKSLASLTSLTILKIEACYIREDGAVHLAERVLPHLACLQSLSLGKNCIGDAGALALGSTVEGPSCLQHLDVSFNEIGHKGVQALASRFGTVVTMSVSNNDIGPLGARALGLMKSLIVLEMDHAMIGDEGASEIAASATNGGGFVNVTVLLCQGNDIGTAGAAHLATALRRMRKLGVLRIGGNEIGDAGAAAIAEVLPSLPKLIEVSLGNNGINCDGARCVATAASQMWQLSHLDLSRNRIGFDGALALAGAFTRLHRLSRVRVDDRSEITVAGEKALLDAMLPVEFL